MAGIRPIPTIKPRASAENLSHNPSTPHAGISSLSRQTNRVSAFRQFGDTVSHTQSNERSNKIFGSINRAIKNRTAPDKPQDTTPLNKNFNIKI